MKDMKGLKALLSNQFITRLGGIIGFSAYVLSRVINACANVSISASVL